MKISDVLWEAACDISDGEAYHTCLAIYSIHRRKMGPARSKARKFYCEYFRRNGSWIFWWREVGTTRSQNERFFHLLMAYEMAKSEGL